MFSQNIISDLKSGFFVALIAMPLCLGISIASLFPPVAGLITAIIGGIVVSFFYKGAPLTIKGPAAGLIVIVMAAVSELGEGDLALGYKRVLAVCAVAAILQIIFAIFKLARLGRIMPPSVIHGMLAAIGIIIISKQIHILLGTIPKGKVPLELLAEIPNSILNINPELFLIGIFTLMAMVIWPVIPNKYLKTIPAAFIALLIVIPLSIFWHLSSPHTYDFLNHSFNIGNNALVNLPQNIFSSWVFPDFSILLKPIAYKHVLMLALVGSIESVLTVIAVESLKETKEKPNLDIDLLGVGFGNLLSALLGGLPMIAEVVRSKANIDNGAQSQWSNFFHGSFLLVAVLWLSPVIRLVPMAALASMLVITGIRLATPGQLIKTYKIGLDQLVLFLITLFMTLATDLLIGIICGIGVKILLHFFRGVKPSEIFTIPKEEIQNGNNLEVKVNGPAIFLNYMSLQSTIKKAHDQNKKVTINFTNATLVDHTTLLCLNYYKKSVDKDSLYINGLDKLKKVSQHEHATHMV